MEETWEPTVEMECLPAPPIGSRAWFDCSGHGIEPTGRAGWLVWGVVAAGFALAIGGAHRIGAPIVIVALGVMMATASFSPASDIGLRLLPAWRWSARLLLVLAVLGAGWVATGHTTTGRTPSNDAGFRDGEVVAVDGSMVEWERHGRGFSDVTERSWVPDPRVAALLAASVGDEVVLYRHEVDGLDVVVGADTPAGRIDAPTLEQARALVAQQRSAAASAPPPAAPAPASAP